jgi:ERCC4-type nuclease
MKLVIDVRERSLIDMCKSITQNYKTVQIETAQLHIGDIIVKTDENKEVLIIERKTFQDLLASIKDGRYEEQSHRLTHSTGIPTHNIIYLLEGMISQVDVKQRKLVYSTMTSLNIFKGFSLWRSSSVNETADMLMTMADKIDRDFMRGRIPAYLRIETGILPVLPTEIPIPLTREILANTEYEIVANSTPPLLVDEIKDVENNEIKNGEIKNGETKNGETKNGEIKNEDSMPNYSTFVKRVKKENITPENIGEIILCQIPGISSKTASAIMKKAGGKIHVLIKELQENHLYLEDILLETGRKMNKTQIKSISDFLL